LEEERDGFVVTERAHGTKRRVAKEAVGRIGSDRGIESGKCVGGF